MKLVPFAVYLLVVGGNRHGVSAAESSELLNDYEGSGWWNEIESAEFRESDYYVKPYSLRVTWWTLYLTAVVIGCIGNTAVVLAEFRNSICQAGLKYLLVQMCILDAIEPIILRFPMFVQEISVDWPFGPVFCGITLISSAPVVVISYISIAALAVEKFLCFIRPGKLPMTRRFAWKIIGATWIFSILLSIPDILYHKTSKLEFLGRNITICHTQWPRHNVNMVYGLVFDTSINIIFRLVPVILIGYVYVRITLQQFSRSSEQGHPLVPPCIQENRKIFSLTDVLVFGFAACELPRLLFHFQSFISDRTNTHVNVAPILWWLTSCRAIICPIVYFSSYIRNRDELQQTSRSERDSGCSNVQFQNGNEGFSTSTI